MKKQGHPQTKATREKISKNSARYWLGKKRPPISPEHNAKLHAKAKGNQYTKGMKFPNRKRPPTKSEETRKKHSAYKGTKAMHWKGGGWQYQKRQTLMRDDWTCQICKIQDRDIVIVDHKIPKKLRPDLIHDPANLWVLCANCHMRKTKQDFILILKVRADARANKKSNGQ
jgi:5-methylcytosine-specific restriction endonuclease McrA